MQYITDQWYYCRDLISWINGIKQLVSSDELAKDVASAEALIDRHQVRISLLLYYYVFLLKFTQVVLLRNIVQRLMPVTVPSKLLMNLAENCWRRNIMLVLTSKKSWKTLQRREKSLKGKLLKLSNFCFLQPTNFETDCMNLEMHIVFLRRILL